MLRKVGFLGLGSEQKQAFKIFFQEYLRTQQRQDNERAELKKQLYDQQITDLKERILTLERKPCPCDQEKK